MGLIFRFFLHIFNLFGDVFKVLDKQNKDKVLRKKILDIQKLELTEKITTKEAVKYLQPFYNVFIEILDKDHEFYKEIILGELKSEDIFPNKIDNIFYNLSFKYTNLQNPIFNKRALSICTASELYTYCFKLGILLMGDLPNKLIIDTEKNDKK